MNRDEAVVPRRGWNENLVRTMLAVKAKINVYAVKSSGYVELLTSMIFCMERRQNILSL